MSDLGTQVPVEIRKPTLSPTAVSEYEICGRRGQYYHDPDIGGGFDLGLLRGGAWHHGLEAWNLARMYYGDVHLALAAIESPDDSQPSEFVAAERMFTIMAGHLYENMFDRDGNLAEGYVHDDSKWHPDPRQAAQDASLQLYEMAKSYMAQPPQHRWMGDGLKVEAVESHVLVDFGSEYHQMNGYIDVVINHHAHGPVGVDYKSATKRWNQKKRSGDPRRLIQAPLYAEAWTRLTGEEMNWFVYDVMTINGQFDRVWVDVSPEVRQVFIKRWVDLSTQIHLQTEAGRDFPHNPSHILCDPRYCGFWDICDMGIGLEQTLIKRREEGEAKRDAELLAAAKRKATSNTDRRN